MAEKLGKPLLYTYGVADMLFLVMVNMEMFYFTAFMTDYAQFPMGIIGIILWITGVVDIVCALAAGIVRHGVTVQEGLERPGSGSCASASGRRGASAGCRRLEWARLDNCRGCCQGWHQGVASSGSAIPLRYRRLNDNELDAMYAAP